MRFDFSIDIFLQYQFNFEFFSHLVLKFCWIDLTAIILFHFYKKQLLRVLFKKEEIVQKLLSINKRNLKMFALV